MLHQELEGTARWLFPLLVFTATLVVGLLIRAIVFRALCRWSRRTASTIDDLVLSAMRWPSYLWIAILAAILAVQTIDLPGEQFDVAVRRALAALLVLSITVGAARLLGDMAHGYRRQVAPDLATGLMRTVIRVVTYVIGVLVILGTLGINIAPLLGALGVGGLAAGLALQPTLSNVFAGMQIAAAKQVRIGDRVRLASGEEGYVADIAWRTTTLRTPSNNLIIIPNSKFADSILTNYNLPDAPANLVVEVNVAYESDPRQVESVLLAEAKRLTRELPLLSQDFDPTVRLQAFGPSALVFQLVVRVRDFDSQFTVWNDVHQGIFACLRQAGIEIPYPTRSIYVRGGGAADGIDASPEGPRGRSR